MLPCVSSLVLRPGMVGHERTVLYHGCHALLAPVLQSQRLDTENFELLPKVPQAPNQFACRIQWRGTNRIKEGILEGPCCKFIKLSSMNWVFRQVNDCFKGGSALRVGSVGRPLLKA